MHGAARPVPGWLRRRGLEVLGVWRMCRGIRAEARASARTAVILFSPGLRTILPIRLACTLARVPLVDERDEFPFVYRGEPGPLGRLWRQAYNAIVFRLYDGHIVISTLLEDFVRARARTDAWIVRVPILVDVEAFSCASAPLDGLVGYAAGELSRSEELLQLMGAIAALAPRHADTRARIVGGASPGRLAGLRRESADLGVADRLDFVGTVGPDDVPAYLCECAALALPRTRALFSEAGFPTKLGEYLATGRPVVVTATGDIPRYLRADVDAFLVPPDDPDAFASALERALYGPTAADVGLAGREVARAQFDPVAHMRNVLDALEGSWARP
jgi:glycosyltransferase involved in cell wall biosynthesis